jgi:amino acid transporter/mannitol/fructose-specific phosphotransferase system IIA component (Ntr-type)
MTTPTETQAAVPGAADDSRPKKLKKELGLFDVYVISTGAMFSSGFFLLPGLATAYAGPSTVLAYLLAGVLIIPAMLSMAELSTALPRAGGTYYFIDRSLGPMCGTIGGLGTWLALALKSGFALLGMGAYLAITPYISDLLPGNAAQVEWTIKVLAVVLTLVFMFVNLMGAKETTRLQGILVLTLLGVLAFFVVQGLWHVLADLPQGELERQYRPFLHEENGWGGLVATIGLVFVSYAGLTKVASVSEEVKRPDRNLPLGMILSLATATAIYVVGVFIMVAVLNSDELRSDLTPVATAAEAFFTWLPYPLGLLLIVAAALAAFASTGNAGILAASRYPLAMARDGLVDKRFARIGKFGTPTWGIVTTAGLMIFFILALSAKDVAKLASAFNLLVFGIINVSVVVMRESRIESYDPGFRSPLYPWTQIAGLGISGWLILEMGPLAILFTLGVIAVGLLWYFYKARHHVARDGAIYHWFERLGHRRHEPLDTEFREILMEKGARASDPFDDVVARAVVVDAEPGQPMGALVRRVAESLAPRLSIPEDELANRFTESAKFGNAPVSRGAMLPHFRSHQVDTPHLAIVRVCDGIEGRMDAERSAASADDEAGDGDMSDREKQTVYAVLFLISPEDDPGVHLRILAHIAGRIEQDDFLEAWCGASDEQQLKEILLRDERFLGLTVHEGTPTAPLLGMMLRDMTLPRESLVAMVHRDGQVFVPHAQTQLLEGDRLTIIGEPKSITELRGRFAPADHAAGGPATGKTGEGG